MDLESLVNWESPRFPGSRSSYDECGIILYTKTGLSAHASKEDAREQGTNVNIINIQEMKVILVILKYILVVITSVVDMVILPVFQRSIHF